MAKTNVSTYLWHSSPILLSSHCICYLPPMATFVPCESFHLLSPDFQTSVYITHWFGDWVDIYRWTYIWWTYLVDIYRWTYLVDIFGAHIWCTHLVTGRIFGGNIRWTYLVPDIVDMMWLPYIADKYQMWLNHASLSCVLQSQLLFKDIGSKKLVCFSSRTYIARKYQRLHTRGEMFDWNKK